MDLSDGLADALRQVAAASGVGMSIDAAALPVSEDVLRWHEQHGGDPLGTVLGGGDDYELLFTVRPSHRGRLRTVRQQLGDLPVTRIGVVTTIRSEHDTVEAIAAEKGKLVALLPGDGTAVLNADDARVLAMQAHCPGRVLTYGVAPSATVRTLGVEVEPAR